MKRISLHKNSKKAIYHFGAGVAITHNNFPQTNRFSHFVTLLPYIVPRDGTIMLQLLVSVSMK
jgi:hypothetical protein